MDRTAALASTASDLVGTPFRLQGRDPAHGLDCIGLVLACLDAVGAGIALPADYRPHRRRLALPADALRAAGLCEARGARTAGDILILRPAPAQVHAAVAVGGGDIVHAHAGLGRVVLSPLPDSWAVLSHWRLGPDPHCDGEHQWPR
ncbi:NlpC/P60 family protein [Alteriqipengyuania sp. 357]